MPLPTELYDALETIKGESYLWQRHPTELKARLVARNWPSHQLNSEFSPQRLYSWFETLVTDFRIVNPDRTPIPATCFAFTKAWAAGIDPRKASIAIGCNVDTLMKHYVQMDEQEVTDDVFAQLNA